eukprot:GDKI01042289.1.p1 GENE.GDKI01042289.1~~GDKI01042289.1.p1  ORF type:complete len:1905 (-),score=768.44 GDKI01042289.1:313-5853(-)
MFVQARFTAQVDGLKMPSLKSSSTACENCIVQEVYLLSGENVDAPVYQIRLAPIADGKVTVRVPEGITTDMVGNNNQASDAFETVYDSSRPSVSVVPLNGVTDGKQLNFATFFAVVKFSERVSGFRQFVDGKPVTGQLPHITVLNGQATFPDESDANSYPAVSADKADQEYVVKITLLKEGSVSIVVPEAVAADLAGNPSRASSTLSLTFDKTAPTVVSFVTSANGAFNSDLMVTAEFSEQVTTLNKETGLDLVNGKAYDVKSSLGSEGRTVTTFRVTPVAEGPVAIGIKAGAVFDMAGNMLVKYNAPAVPAAPSFIQQQQLATVAGTGAGLVYDITPPKVLSFTAPETASTAPITLTVELSEALDTRHDANVLLSCLKVTNGQADAVANSDNANTLLVSVVPTDAAGAAAGEIVVTVQLDLDNCLATDLAGNKLTGDASKHVVTKYSIGQPAVALSHSTLNGKVKSPAVVNGAFTVTATWSNGVVGFTQAAIAVSGGQILDGTFTQRLFSQWTFDVKPQAGVDAVSVSIPAAAVKSEHGAVNIASSELKVKFDNQKPIAKLTTSKTIYNTPFEVTAVFSEKVIGFGTASLQVTNGKLLEEAQKMFVPFDAKDEGATYSFTIVPTADGPVSVLLKAGDDLSNDGSACRDVAGNACADASLDGVMYDASKPQVLSNGGVSVSPSLDKPANEDFHVTITFSEAVSAPAASAFVLSNNAHVQGDVLNSKGNDELDTSWSFVVTPVTDGDIFLSLPEGMTSDIAGNPSVSLAATKIGTFDKTRPSVAISSPTGGVFNKGLMQLDIVFSESVSGFSADSLDVSGGSVSAGSFQKVTSDGLPVGSHYRAAIKPEGDSSTITVSVKADSCQDAAGNKNHGSNSVIRKFDAVPPPAELTASVEQPVAKSFLVTVTWSEAIDEFTLSDIQVTNGIKGTVLTADGTGKVFTFSITPQATGKVSVSIPAGMAYDAAGNANLETHVLNIDGKKTESIDTDLVSPTATLSTGSKPVIADKSFTATVTFSKPVSGLTASDFVQGGCTISDVYPAKGPANVYTFTVTSTGAEASEMHLQLLENTVLDAPGNGNMRSNEIVVTYDSHKPVVSLTLDAETNKPAHSGASLSVFVAVSEETDKPLDSSVISVSVESDSSEDTTIDASGLRIHNSQTNYVIDIRPHGTAKRTVKVVVPAGAVKDLAGNTNEDAELTFVWDGEAPTLQKWEVVPDSAVYTNNGAVFAHSMPLSLDATFSKPLLSLQSDAVECQTRCQKVVAKLLTDTTCSDAFKCVVVVSDGEKASDKYSLTIGLNDPLVDASMIVSVSLYVKADVLTDAAGNALQKTKAFAFTYDSQTPLVQSVEFDSGSFAHGGFTSKTKVPVTIIFDEPVRMGDAEALSVSVGEVKNVRVQQDDNTVLAFDIDLSQVDQKSDIAVSLSVLEGLVTDLAGNPSSAESQPVTFTLDRTAPTLDAATLIDKATGHWLVPEGLTGAGFVTITLRFSEPVKCPVPRTGKNSGDKEVVNGLPVSGIAVYPAVPAAFWTKGTSMAASGTVIAGKYTREFQAEADFAQLMDGKVSLSLLAGYCMDRAGNAIATLPVFSTTVDHTKPALLSLTSASGSGSSGTWMREGVAGVNGRFQVVAMFSEDLKTIPTAKDFVLTLAQKEDGSTPMLADKFAVTEPVRMQDDKHREVKNAITFWVEVPEKFADEALLSVGLSADCKATDMAGNTLVNPTSQQGMKALLDVNNYPLRRFIDTRAPVPVIVTNLPSATTIAAGTASFQFAVTFDNPVKGFTPGAVQVTNGALGGMSVAKEGKEYVFTITPQRDGKALEVGETVTIVVHGGACADAAGNLNERAVLQLVYGQ